MFMLSCSGRIINWAGKSTEVKPTDQDGGFFVELDTGVLKYFDKDTDTWETFGGDSNG